MKADKVLFIHDGPLYTNINGECFGIHYNDQLVERYRYLGSKVSFLMRNQLIDDLVPSAKYSQITAENFSFIPIPDFKSIRLYFPNKSKARKIIHQSIDEHDVIVIRMPSAAGAIAIEYCLRTSKPFLTEMVACTLDAYWHYSLLGKCIAHYKYYKVKRLMARVDYTIYVSSVFLQKRYPNKTHSVSCSNVVLRPLDEATLSERLTKIENTQEKVLTIGTVGTLDVKYKGQEYVIRALYKLKEKNIKIHYHLVGQGNPGYLQSLIDNLGMQDQIKIIGPLPHDKIFEFFKNIDMYVHPSLTEGMPRAVIEAMSTACPVLGSDTGGITELLEAQELFAPGEIKEIASKLSQLEKGKLIEMSKRNFEKAKDFDKYLLEKRRKDFYDLFMKGKI